jgi:hypothetical protein
MFNQLAPSDIVGAIGVTARDAARGDDPGGEFARDQLLSAYSATRHLSVELTSYAPVWERFTSQAAERVRAAEGVDAGLEAVAASIAGGDVAVVGAAIADLLAELRGRDTPGANALRSELHALLRELADREVTVLADALA